MGKELKERQNPPKNKSKNSEEKVLANSNLNKDPEILQNQTENTEVLSENNQELESTETTEESNSKLSNILKTLEKQNPSLSRFVSENSEEQLLAFQKTFQTLETQDFESYALKMPLSEWVSLYKLYARETNSQELERMKLLISKSINWAKLMLMFYCFQQCFPNPKLKELFLNAKQALLSQKKLKRPYFSKTALFDFIRPMTQDEAILHYALQRVREKLASRPETELKKILENEDILINTPFSAAIIAAFLSTDPLVYLLKEIDLFFDHLALMPIGLASRVIHRYFELLKHWTQSEQNYFFTKFHDFLENEETAKSLWQKLNTEEKTKIRTWTKAKIIHHHFDSSKNKLKEHFVEHYLSKINNIAYCDDKNLALSFPEDIVVIDPVDKPNTLIWYNESGLLRLQGRGLGSDALANPGIPLISAKDALEGHPHYGAILLKLNPESIEYSYRLLDASCNFTIKELEERVKLRKAQKEKNLSKDQDLKNETKEK